MLVSHPRDSASAAAVSARPARSFGLGIASWALVVLLVSNAPLHVAMPLASDTVLYDLQAQHLLAGGVLYRDIFETNLPGIVWVHAVLRPLVGWSSEAMRLADLAIFAGVVWLLVGCLRRRGLSPTRQVTATVFLFWCYLSVSEWCHCQRDTWMLLPALGALWLRLSQRERLVRVSHPSHQPTRRARDERAPTLFAWAVVEGLLWAAAFWIKPFVAVPALACFVVTAAEARNRQRIAIDAAGLLCGGLAAGAAGVAWLAATGAWPHFVETFLDWNPDYVAGGRSRWTLERMYGMGYRLFPWILIHVAAVPAAARAVVRGIRATHSRLSFSPASAVGRIGNPSCEPMAIFAAFYLAWLAQAIVLQQPFDYIQVPPMLLGLTLLAARGPRGMLSAASGVSMQNASRHPTCSPAQSGGRAWHPPAARLAAIAFVSAAAVSSPCLKADRLAGWWDSLSRGSTPELRDRLAYLRTPDYGELEHVLGFLRSQHVRDGDVTCYHVHLIHLYPKLGIRPSTRYVGIEALRRLFPRHRELIDKTVAASGHRFVVTDLVEAGLSVSQASAVAPDGRRQLPPAFPTHLRHEFPWNLPVVFRANRYLVHAVSGGVPSGADRTAATN